RCAQTNHVLVVLEAVECGTDGDRSVVVEVADTSTEHAVAGLTDCSVDLHNFEVVSCTELPCTDVNVVARGGQTITRSGADALLLVRQSNGQGAVGITQTGGDTTTVAVGFVQVINAVDVKRGTLSAVGVEGVTNAELEAREVGGLVHDH